MIKLIKNELYKIFHRKSIYVMGIIILAFILLNNILYKSLYNDDGSLNNPLSIANYELEFIKEELKELDPNKESDKTLYVDYKTQYDVLELSSKYSNSSWQNYIINNKLYNIIYNRNYYTYIDKSSVLFEENEKIYNKYLNYLEDDDYKAFVSLEIEEIDKTITELNKEKEKTTDKQKLLEIEKSLSTLNFDKEILNYRLDKNISYESSYMNTALDNYKNAHNYLESIDNKDKLSYEEKKIYNSNLEEYNINKYILDNNVNLQKENTVRSSLMNSINNYEILIVILIIIVSGTIVSNEFSKGTIKNLLVRPYKRTTVLLSKFISVAIVLLISIGYLLLCDLLIGGLFFSFDSLSIPAIIYNFNTGSLEEYNVFIYVLIKVLTKLPMFILILSLAFMFSTVTNNSQVSIALPIVFYMFSSMINGVAMSFNLKWMKFFPTLNWNFEEYLFGGLPTFQYTNLTNSIIVVSIYFILMVILSIVVFKKKNIKNI